MTALLDTPVYSDTEPIENSVTPPPVDTACNAVTTLSPAGTSTGNGVTEPATDWELVALAAIDRDAFGELYRRHRGFVFGFLLGRTDRDTADDLTSETFARALRSIDRVQDTGRPFAAWLITIARNAVFDHFKRVSTRLASGHSLDDLPFDIVEPRTFTDEVDARFTLTGAFAKLCPADQEILVQRYLLDRRPSEMAADDPRGRNVGAIKAAQHRAEQNLRRILRGAA